MLTQAMPALVKALTGVLPPSAVKQLTQALGNCNQPLTHRGDVQIAPPQVTTRNGLVSGARSGGLPWATGWSPQQYGGGLPEAGNNNPWASYEIAGFNNNNTWNQTNYGGNQFNLPLNQQFTLNNYYGAPVFNISGLMFTDGMYTPTFGSGGGEIPIINGWPMPFLPPLFGPNGQPFVPYPMPNIPSGGFGPMGPYVPPAYPGGPGPFNPPPGFPPGYPVPIFGPAGPAGSPGGHGSPGAPGFPGGVPGAYPYGFPGGFPTQPGAAPATPFALPNVTTILEPQERTLHYISADINDFAAVSNETVMVPTNAISGGTVSLKIPTDACKGGTVTLPAGIPTNAISGGTITLDVPVNALAAGDATMDLPTNAISDVDVDYDKANEFVDTTALQVLSVPQGTVVGGSISVQLTTQNIQIPTSATLNTETCAITLNMGTWALVTGVKSATFTPTTVASKDMAVSGSAKLVYTTTAATVKTTPASTASTTVAISGDLAETDKITVSLAGTKATLSGTSATFTPTDATASAVNYSISGTPADEAEQTIDFTALLAADKKADVLVPEVKRFVRVYGP